MSGPVTVTNRGILQNQNTTSNYTVLARWLPGGSISTTYGREIGHHNTGGDGTGSIVILPYETTNTSPWGGNVGLFIQKGVVKIDGVELSKNGHAHNYLALDGSTYYTSIVGGGSVQNVTGYRLIGTATIAAWGNYRSVFAVSSRHGGNGIFSIAYGCNSATVSAANDYCEIRYFGNNTTNVVFTNTIQCYVSSDGAKMYFFYYHSDYDSARFTCLNKWNSSFIPNSSGTWMTTIDTATYGTLKASTIINTTDKLGTATVGSTTKPIYLSGGTATASNATVGSSTTPVYMNTGTIAACGSSLSVSITGSSASCTGNAATATKLATARTISLTGSVTGSGSFDGSGNLSIATTTNHTHTYAGSSTAGGAATSANALVVTDTRSVNSAPNDTAFDKRMLTADFKYNSTIGSPPNFSGNYCGLLSFAPWTGTSGGHGYQLAFGYNSTAHPRLAIRCADLSATSWGTWYKIYTSDDKPTAADIGAAATSHTHSYLPLSGGTLTGTLYIGSTSDTAERQCNVRSGAGSIYLYSQAASTGGRGLYGTNSAGTSIGILSVSSSNVVSLNGNAATATKLATARTIRTNLASTSTASFDGSANIAPGVTGTLPVANGGTGVTTEAAIGLKAYPVGAVYISYVSTSPATLFGGTWTQLTGRYLRMANDVSTGGADTVTLTVDQIPSHSHNYRSWMWNQQSQVYNGIVPVADSYWGWEDYSPGVQVAGGGQAHSNMPAYQDLYAWRRTA